MKKELAAIGLVSTTLLSACGGSSGGGDVGPSVFTDFASLNPNGTTLIEGQAVTAEFEQDLISGGTTSKILSGGSPATILTTSQNGEVVAISVSAAGSGVNLDARSQDVVVISDVGAIAISDGNQVIAFADPESLGYNYQTYGVWIDGFYQAVGTAGAGSFGSRSPSSPAPSGDTATYRGYSTGFTDVSGKVVGVDANASVTTDFSSYSFSTANSIATDFQTLTSSSAPALDLAGSGVVGPNGFSGSVSSAVTSGTMSGSFYGPNGEEAGGTFATSGATGNYIGAFGARRR